MSVHFPYITADYDDKGLILSSSFTIQFDGNDDSDTISFVNHQNWLGDTFTLLLNEDNVFNSLSWWLPTPAGRLYLFPSRLEHCVNEVQGTKDRWSLSFNTFTNDAFSKSLLKKLYKGKIIL